MLKEIQTARLCEDRKEGHFRGRAQWWQMYVSMHTQVTHIVSKYVCMYVCMYHCFKMKRYDFLMFCKGACSPIPDTGHILWELELNTDCFKIIICDIAYSLYEISRSKTRHCPSEAWTLGSQHCCPPSQNSG